jgi:hypothetical protein
MAPVRGPDGKFLTREQVAALEQSESELPTESTTNQSNTNNKEKSRMSDVVFVDELPKISRNVESGVWVERLAPLEDNVGKWAQVYGPTPNPHAVINNLRSGNAAGVEAEKYSFAGRILDTVTELNDEGEEVEVKQGYVYARLDTPEQAEERIAKQRQRAEKRAATMAAKAEAGE